MRWLDPGRARDRLTYPLDREMLDRSPRRRRPIPYSCWSGTRRPASARNGRAPTTSARLDNDGRRQARRLARCFACFAPERIISADRVRCVQTVEPLAESSDYRSRSAGVLGRGLLGRSGPGARRASGAEQDRTIDRAVQPGRHDSRVTRSRSATGCGRVLLTRKAALGRVLRRRYLRRCRLLRGCRALIRRNAIGREPVVLAGPRPTMRSAGSLGRSLLGRSLLRRSLLRRSPLGGGLLGRRLLGGSLARDLRCRLPRGWRRLLRRSRLGHLLGTTRDRLELGTRTERRHRRLLDLDRGTGRGVAGDARRAITLLEDAEAGQRDLLTLRDVRVDGVDDGIEAAASPLLVGRTDPPSSSMN